MKPALSRPKARAALMEGLEHAVRRSSAKGVIFGQTVASRVGISSSDLECLDFLNLEGRVTAGRLAEVTGLTTGAITGVVGRLAKVGRFYQHMRLMILKDWETLSDADLRLLLRFMTQGYKTMLAATEELKAMIDAPKRKRSGAKKPARAL